MKQLWMETNSAGKRSPLAIGTFVGVRLQSFRIFLDLDALAEWTLRTAHCETACECHHTRQPNSGGPKSFLSGSDSWGC